VMDYAELMYLPAMSAATSALIECDALCAQTGGDPIRAVYFLLKLQVCFDRHRKNKGGSIFLKSLEAERIVQAAWVLSRVAIEELFTGDELRDAALQPDMLNDIETFRKHRTEFCKPVIEKLQGWIQQGAGSAFANRGDLRGYLGALDALQAILRYETNRPLMVYWYEEAPIWEFKLAQTILPDEKCVPATKLAFLKLLKEALPRHCGRAV
jgi:hypothetical protein